MNNRVYQLLRQSTQGQLFTVLRDNKYAFRKCFNKPIPVDEMYKKSPDDCIDYLKELYKEANIIDRAIIKELVKELPINNP